MALEQMTAFRLGRPQDELGETETLEPDGFPLLRSSPLKDEHALLCLLLRSNSRLYHAEKIFENPELPRLLQATVSQRTRIFQALLERCFAYDARLSRQGDFGSFANFYDYGAAANVLAELFEKGLDFELVVPQTIDWFNCYRFNHYATPIMDRVLRWIAANYSAESLPHNLRHRLIALDGQIRDASYAPSENMGSVLAGILGQGPWEVVSPIEAWSKAALEQIEAEASTSKKAWLDLLAHCHGAGSSKPSGKWLKTGSERLKAIGAAKFVQCLLKWIPLFDAGRTHPMIGMSWENVDERQRPSEMNATVIRGLLWLCPATPTPDLVRAIGKVAHSGYRKIRGLGPRATKVGNAAVYALSEIGTPEAVGQLAMLKARVKFGTALKEIEKAYASTAKKLGLPVEEIEEMAVPTYGLTDVGICEEAMGEFTARLTVTGTDSTELVWLKADGKAQKSVPASVKASHAEELKELQAAAKDIQRMLPAQRERIDGLFLQQKSWPLAVWRERYLDHPLVGVLARRLIWEFTTRGRTTAGMFSASSRRRESAQSSDGMGNQRGLTSTATDLGVEDLDLRPVPSDDTTVVRLWHPIGKDVDEVLAWRGWLETRQIQQPFKQAHREVYLLTDAERRTGTYSNRYAAHVLKQHQFNALCAARGWKNKLRLMVDDAYPPATRHLPQWNLRAEFWVEGAGSDYRTDANESGTYLHLTTDQVRFYRPNAAQLHAQSGSGTYAPAYGQTADEPIPLEQVPPLVFSEIMRDVDLFVGVASVGNDPTWNDGGPGGQHRDYWQHYAFGDLGVSAANRKVILERLVPRLKIAKQCSFADKFLVVRGSVRTYKIHLGSGNILMEPNDQYLCIVPKQGAVEKEPVFLPFEGDRTLSLILSKAFLLAEDGKIKDETILTQIRK